MNRADTVRDVNSGFRDTLRELVDQVLDRRPLTANDRQTLTTLQTLVHLTRAWDVALDRGEVTAVKEELEFVMAGVAGSLEAAE